MMSLEEQYCADEIQVVDEGDMRWVLCDVVILHILVLLTCCLRLVAWNLLYKSDLKLRDPPVTQVLRFKACTITPG